MKKLLFVALFCAIAAATSAKDPESEKSAAVNDRLIGRWELSRPEGSSPTELSKVRQKIYTKESYVVLEVDKTNNTTYVDFIGKLTNQSANSITETPIYTHPPYKSMLGNDFKISYKIEGNRLYLNGLNYKLDEVWIRISE